MKKILASLLVLALCAPAMAATITIEDIGGGQATITVATEGEEAPIVGLGLDVDVTGGEVTAVSVDTANFNIFPDYAYFLETDEDPNGYEYGEGHPVAAMEEAGKLELPQSSFALSLGNLNGEEIAGADGAAEVVITVTWSGDLLEVCENATRGGIVANGEEEAGIALDAECAELAGGCATCFGDDDGNELVVFDELITFLTLMDNNGFSDIPSSSADYRVCFDENQDGIMVFDELITLLTMMDNSGFADIPCPVVP